MTYLTAVIITYNEAQHIADCVASLQFADEILVMDSHSTDETVQLARDAGARVLFRTFDNFPGQRNAALQAASQNADWVLFVDADERVTPELAEEIRQALLRRDFVAWRIPRHNYIFGQLTRGAGWYPDYQTRLLKVGAVHFDPDRHVHEVVSADGPQGTLKAHLEHYNYENVAQFLSKQQRYARLDAQMLYDQGLRPKPHNYILQPLRQFRWRFFTLKGYRDGWHGLRLSVLMAWYEWVKYRSLGQLWREPGHTASTPRQPHQRD